MKISLPRIAAAAGALVVSAAFSPAASAFTFTPAPAPFAAGDAPRGAAVADFDGDGHDDAAVLSTGDATVRILLGDGSGGLTALAGTPPSAGAAQAIVAGDVDGDDDPDVVIAGGGGAQLLPGDGDGSLGSAVAVAAAAGSDANAIALADVVGDGALDLALVDDQQTGVEILAGDGDGGFTAAASVPIGRGLSAIAAADFNGDGDGDLALGSGGTESFKVLLGDGDGTFTPAQSSPVWTGTGMASLSVAEVNGDGELDLVGATADGSSVLVQPGVGDGTFSLGQRTFLTVRGGGVAQAVATSLDGSGPDDVLVVRPASDDLLALVNESAPPSVISPPLVSGDSNANGWLVCSFGVWRDASGYTFWWRVDGTRVVNSSVYQPTAADIGKTIECEIVARNAVGETSAFSAPVVGGSGPISQQPPAREDPPAEQPPSEQPPTQGPPAEQPPITPTTTGDARPPRQGPRVGLLPDDAHPLPLTDPARLLIASSRLSVAGGATHARLRCAAPRGTGDCRGTAVLRRVGGAEAVRGRVLAKSRPYRIRAGASARIALRLTAAGKRQLKALSRGALAVRVETAFTAADGRSGLSTAPATLR